MIASLLRAPLAAVLLALVAGSAHAAGFTPYRVGDWARLRHDNAGTPYVVHFWGLTCGPCMDELPQWARYLQGHPQLRVVFVEVDEVPAAAAQRALHDAGLEHADQRALAVPFDEYVRHEIDPRWMGELPATFLVDRRGQARRLMGTMDFGALQSWAMKAGGR